MTGCEFAFCGEHATQLVPDFGIYCEVHADKARRIARLRAFGLRARGRRPADVRVAAVVEDRGQLALEVQP